MNPYPGLMFWISLTNIIPTNDASNKQECRSRVPKDSESRAEYSEQTGTCLVMRETPSGLNWTQADELCRGEGGQLVVDDSLHKHLQIKDLLEKFDLNFGVHVWLGGKYELGEWTWANGITAKNVTSKNDNHCQCYLNGEMKDCDCWQRFAFICQGHPDKAIFDVGLKIAAILKGTKNTYFVISSDSKDIWYRAREQCQRLRADLVTDLTDLISVNDTAQVLQDEKYWMGLMQSELVWQTGTAVSGSLLNEKTDTTGGSCISIYVEPKTEIGYRWRLHSCDSETTHTLCDFSNSDTDDTTGTEEVYSDGNSSKLRNNGVPPEHNERQSLSAREVGLLSGLLLCLAVLTIVILIFIVFIRRSWGPWNSQPNEKPGYMDPADALATPDENLYDEPWMSRVFINKKKKKPSVESGPVSCLVQERRTHLALCML